MIKERIRIVAVGDLSFNGYYDQVLKRNGPDYPFLHIQPYWREADIRLGNLESPPTLQPRATPSKLTLRGSLQSVASLVSAGFDCLSVANNHMMDFGPAGLTEACSRVTGVGIHIVGAGRCLEKATAPIVLDVHGHTIGILGFCDVVQDSPLYATNESPGVSPADVATCVTLIRNLRPHVDWVIVHLHWGTELCQLPSPSQRTFAHTLIATGADVIIGHHPHVIQPIERIEGGVVAYSLGNFLFSETFWRGHNDKGEAFSSKLRLSPLTRRTGWLELLLHKETPIEYRFCPAVIGRTLQVFPDDTTKRRDAWAYLNAQLPRPDYASLYREEVCRAAHRRNLQSDWKPFLRRVEIKLLEWHLLPCAIVED